jgi:hypothetical protein
MNWFDRRAAAEFTFDRLGDATSLVGDVDLELVVGPGVVAAIAAVGDDAGEVRADLRSRERVAVPRVKPEGRLRGCRAAPSLLISPRLHAVSRASEIAPAEVRASAVNSRRTFARPSSYWIRYDMAEVELRC